MTANMERAYNVTLQGKRLKVVNKIKYLGSLLNGQSGIEAAVGNNCTTARLAITKLRHKLVRSTFTRIKCRQIEKCVKPVLLYGQETAITRITREKNIDKKGTILNKAHRIVLKKSSKKHTVEILALKFPLRDIQTEIAVRRGKLWLGRAKLQD